VCADVGVVMLLYKTREKRNQVTGKRAVYLGADCQYQ